jgi:predicted membrane-bound spermidine synthase
MLPLLYALFIASGAAGLMYESIWSRYLGLLVGHAAYAQVLVLVIFLGGMSIGAFTAGRRSERLADPLRWYAIVELAVGVIGLLFHPLFVAVSDAAYGTVFPALQAGVAVTVVKWLLAALLILPQSILLGATFPLMSAGALRRAPRRPGRTLALLYFANSLGAAGGVLVAGFATLAAWGLPGTLWTAAALNAAVAVGAFAVALAPARRVGSKVQGGLPPHAHDATPSAPVPTHSDAAATIPTRAAVPRALTRAMLVTACGTAVASFVYEVAWIRMLSLVAGSATHSFEIMLSAFILGLALGAFWVRGRADRFRAPVRALAVTQWVMGTLAIATLPIYVASFEWMASLLHALDSTDGGYRLFSVARYAFSLAVMLPATFCAGITLPLITRILLSAGAGEEAVGRVYGVNTLGSILGAALAGLVLMPLLGLKWLLVVGALTDVGLGFYLAAQAARVSAPAERRTAPADPVAPAGPAPAPNAGSPALTWALLAAVTFVILGSAADAVPFEQALLTSGVYRYRRVNSPRYFDMLFYRDGRTATVSVRRAKGQTLLTLSTNGKPDASLGTEWIRPGPADTARAPLAGDQVTQVLLPLMALAHAPAARDVAVIGQGSGMTSHLLLGSPAVRRLATIEIEPEMVRASRLFYPANRRVFDDRRSTFVVDDAKAFFASSGRTFDIIVSEPSNPWVSGVSGLFTTEFYRRVRTYLAPGGVFAQWMHLYEIDDPLVLGVMAAIHRNFPSYQVYLVSSTDVLVVASNERRAPVPDWARVVAYPGVAADLRRSLPLTPSSLESARLIDREALAPLLDSWPTVNSDFHPALDLGAERTRYTRASAIGFRRLPTGRFDPVAAMRRWRVDFDTSTRAPLELPRPEARARAARARAMWARRAVGADTAREPSDDAAVSADPPSAPDAQARDALYRRAAYEAVLATGRRPADWHRFVTEALHVEYDLHQGTSGVADESFYGPLLAYLARAGAPAEAVAAVQFTRALRRWDWPQAASAADVLVAALPRHDQWVQPDVLHDGSVVAALQLGDAQRARRLFQATGTLVDRSQDDLRTDLLPAWVAAALTHSARR